MNCTAEFLREVRVNCEMLGQPVPETFVETGTYHGWTTELAAGIFETVHTIELSQVFYDADHERMEALPNVTHHLGDSRAILPQLDLPGPVWFYLDAHWCRATGVAGDKDFPLWAELEWIRGRRQADVIAVDDVFVFGVSKTPDTWWESVTDSRILGAMDRVLKSERHNDQFMMYREKAK